MQEAGSPCPCVEMAHPGLPRRRASALKAPMDPQPSLPSLKSERWAVPPSPGGGAQGWGSEGLSLLCLWPPCWCLLGPLGCEDVTHRRGIRAARLSLGEGPMEMALGKPLMGSVTCGARKMGPRRGCWKGEGCEGLQGAADARGPPPGAQRDM